MPKSASRVSDNERSNILKDFRPRSRPRKNDPNRTPPSKLKKGDKIARQMLMLRKRHLDWLDSQADSLADELDMVQPNKSVVSRMVFDAFIDYCARKKSDVIDACRKLRDGKL